MISTNGRARFAAFAIAAGLAMPAAAERAPRPAEQNSVAPAIEGGGSSRAAAPKLYCVRDTLIGTRMPKKVCKTADQWAVEGVDVGKSR